MIVNRVRNDLYYINIMKYALLLLIISFHACRPKVSCDHEYITLENKSDKTFYILNKSFRNWEEDTTLIETFSDPKSGGQVSFNDSEHYKLSPFGINVNIISTAHDKSCFSDDFYREKGYGTVIFFFDSSKIYSLSWDTVKRYNMYEKRVILYVHQLDSLSWRVSYP